MREILKTNASSYKFKSVQFILFNDKILKMLTNILNKEKTKDFWYILERIQGKYSIIKNYVYCCDIVTLKCIFPRHSFQFLTFLFIFVYKCFDIDFSAKN